MQLLRSKVVHQSSLFGEFVKCFVQRNPRKLFCLDDFWERPVKRRKFGRYKIVKPGIITEDQIPSHIQCPSYYESTVPDPPPLQPEIKNSAQIKKMRKSCSLARYILGQVENFVKVGCSTEEINQQVLQMTVRNGAYPSPLHYRGFPKAVCTSVNNVACHGIPDDRVLVDGDIVNVDVTVFLDGFHGDCSATFLVGNVDLEGRTLVRTTRSCLERAVSVCRPGEKFSKIGEVVEDMASEAGLSVVPAFLGHGIGSYFHGPPDIYHCYNDHPGTMAEGMTFTIEPVLAQGSHQIVILEDGWTAVTLDHGRAAQFEHTVLITETGVDVLT